MCWVNISSTAQALHHQIVLNTTFQMVSSDLVSCMQCATCKGCLWEGNRGSCFCVSSDPKHFRSVEKIANLRKTVCLVVTHGCSFCLANSWKADSLDYYWENMPVAWMLRRVCERDVTRIRPDEMAVENTALLRAQGQSWEVWRCEVGWNKSENHPTNLMFQLQMLLYFITA